MSRVVVFTFDAPFKAMQARAALRDLEKGGTLILDDAVVVEKDAAGRVHRRREPPYGVLLGAGVGGLMGVLLSFMFPLVSIPFGVIGGGVIARLVNPRVPEEFIADAQATLQHQGAALLILLRDGDVAALAASLRGFPLRLYETTLAPEHEAALRQALQ